ncbi:MAG: DNA polymerase III subunit epsilon [Salinisphaera sp.]|nr:DNA polymerase III subunit epsilon [Salinisphaera sp.]
MRQIVLDTETTGLEPGQGHRIIEIGCVEICNRRITDNDLHHYINPERDVEAGAQAVHGIDQARLADTPRFADIADELKAYLSDAELIIHNAPFDLGFLDAEYRRIDSGARGLASRHTIVDTLADARRLHPGQRNSLDALCKRYDVDDSARALHGALLDAQLLAEVYLAMTGGQTDMLFTSVQDSARTAREVDLAARLAQGRRPCIVHATETEAAAHAVYLEHLAQASNGDCLWQQLESRPHPTPGGQP